MATTGTKKKIDNRIRILIENAVQQHFRSFFVIIGDRGKDQVVNLHYMLSKAVVKARPSVLWCYKDELGFSSHRKKRMKQIKKKMSKVGAQANEEDPFELFISSTNIRYTYYKESHKILGNTFGMCVLQDFEAITPNLLARTIETVEGGGMIVVLLRSMTSFSQFYTLAMDIHDRLRTESQSQVTPRFNERFMLSLSSMGNCLVLDDELNLLPISSHVRSIVPLEKKERELPHAAELKQLKTSLKDTAPAGALVALARTLDQAKAILTFIDAISEKTLRSTVTLTASRGRGKSAALGVAMAAAVAYGYSNIFVTSPSPENLKTLFEFIFKGFDALEYKEHLDYDLVQSTNPEFNNAIVRVNIYHTHRQTIQYIHPSDAAKLGQAELVVIDEAAAIPLPHVKKLLGPYLVFLASTVNGYEGTGRSLSLKLIEQLRQQQNSRPATTVAGPAATGTTTTPTTAGGRNLREITLEEPIRYAPGDYVEKWLNQLLCLDVNSLPRLGTGCPPPDKCELYHVNKDTLFSYHPASEAFLQRMMALYVSSHYKNTPNDLMLMSDAPGHQLFVLLGPIENVAQLPDVLCVIQVALEGGLSRQNVESSLLKGEQAAGDLIPWTISQQFQDPGFGSLSGGRVVRIATHPDYQRMGYGSVALKLLGSYYQGDVVPLDESAEEPATASPAAPKANIAGEGSLLTETIAPRKNVPPLLTKLSERRPEPLHYLGVSFGITEPLFKFWKRAGYTPVYVRLTQNETTGEHTAIMFRSLRTVSDEIECSADWLDKFSADFKRRFMSLLGYDFRSLPIGLGLAILDPHITSAEQEADVNGPTALTKTEMDVAFTPYDVKRLEKYANQMLDYHVVMDLMPLLARFFFSAKIPVHLSKLQAAIFLAVGLQLKSLDEVAVEFSLPMNQIMANFQKVMHKLVRFLRKVQEAAIEQSIPSAPPSRIANAQPIKESIDEELQRAVGEIVLPGGQKLSTSKQQQINLIASLASSADMVLPKDENDIVDETLKKTMHKHGLKRKDQDGQHSQHHKQHKPHHNNHKNKPGMKK